MMVCTKYVLGSLCKIRRTKIEMCVGSLLFPYNIFRGESVGKFYAILGGYYGLL